MDRYIGMDTHDNSCVAIVLDARGRRVIEQVIETNTAALKTFVLSVPGSRYLAIEEGNLSAWLHDQLSPLVKEMVVVIPPKSKNQKNDKLDAFKLADGHRTGAFRTLVYKPDRCMAELRAAVRGYLVLRKDTTRAKSRLKAVFRSRGVFRTGEAIYELELREKLLVRLPVAERRLAQLLGEELDALLKVQQQAEEHLTATGKRYPAVKLLMTAPGIGPVRAAIIVAVVGTPHRFRTPAQFWSYCGFGIVSRVTSEWSRSKHGWEREPPQGLHLNRNRNAWLKEVFKGAVVGLIGCSPENPLVKGYRARCADGMREESAQLTMARQLAEIILTMWKHKEAYDPTRAERFAERAAA